MKLATRNFTANLACSRFSDSKAREKNSRKKNEGRLEGERGRELIISLSPPLYPPVFLVYNLTRSPLTASLYYLNAWNRLLQTQICKFGRTKFDTCTVSYCATRSWSLFYTYSCVAFFLTQWEKSTVIFPMQPCISFVCGQELFEQFLHDLSK